MPRKYSYIQKHEKEIVELWNKGKSSREIGEELGFTVKQIKQFKTRYNRKKEKIEAGIVLKRRGRPSKDYKVSEEAKIAELKYILARKEAKIKSLEMENELMKDFLSFIERK